MTCDGGWTIVTDGEHQPISGWIKIPADTVFDNARAVLANELVSDRSEFALIGSREGDRAFCLNVYFSDIRLNQHIVDGG